MNKHVIGTKALSGVLELLLRIMFVLGILIDITLPFTLRWALPLFYYGPISEAFYREALAFTLSFGVLMVLFVFFAARVFAAINRTDPFFHRNLGSLGTMSVLSLLLSASCLWYALRGQSILAFVLTLFLNIPHTASAHQLFTQRCRGPS